MNFIINVMPGCQSTEVNQIEITWEEMQEIFNKVDRKGEMTLHEYQNAPDKKRKEDKDGTAWIPCSMIDPSWKRNQENIDKAYFIVLDIDSGMQLEDVRKRIVGYEALIHSSYSHSEEKPKWRVVLPLAEPIPAREVGKIFDIFQERFDELLDASCGHDPARLYYTPACPADAEHLFHYEHIEGAFLDGQAILEAYKSSSSAALATSVLPVSTHVSSSEGVAEGGRNSAGFKLAARFFNDGMEIDAVTDALLVWNEKCDPPLDEPEIHQIAKSAMKTVARKVAVTSKGVDEVVDDMNTKYAWVKKLNFIYRFQFKDFVKIDALRQDYANTSILVLVGGKEKIQTYADVWYRSPRRRTHTKVDFVPGAAAIVDNKINLWQGWGVTPLAGDIVPWIAFLDYLFAGDPDARKWIEQWIAYPIQYPGAKLTTAVVLWSINQGVGKSMLGDTIGKLYGSHFKTISAVELHASFNGWIRDCQFVLGEENSSADQRADSNKLKGMITGDTIIINEKFQPMLEMQNRVNFMFTSNHPDAFHLEDADRRYFVWEIIANRMPNEFYGKFIDWRDNRGGLSAMMHHLQNIDLTGFDPKANALVTEAKREMIHQSKSELERWFGETLEDETSILLTFGKQVTCLEEITETFNRKHRTRTTTTAVSRALRRYHRCASRRVVTHIGRKNLQSLIKHDGWESADNPAWANEYKKSPLLALS